MAWTDTKGDWSQRNQRKGQMFTDQHKRKYYGDVEIKSGSTVGPLQARYVSPLPVPQMYLERSPDPERPYDLFVNYERWIADIRRENAELERRQRMLARKINPEYDPRAPLPRDVIEILGDTIPVEPVLAARQGNPWILGKVSVPDKRLIKYFSVESLDKQYRRIDEPDFSDYEAIDTDFDAEELDESGYVPVDETNHQMRLSEFDEKLESDLDLEDEYDPKATGGTRVGREEQIKVRSPEAERKARQRARKREEAEAARLAAQAELSKAGV